MSEGGGDLPTITLREAAARLNVSKRTLERRLAAGLLPQASRIDGEWRLPETWNALVGGTDTQNVATDSHLSVVVGGKAQDVGPFVGDDAENVGGTVGVVGAISAGTTDSVGTTDTQQSTDVGGDQGNVGSTEPASVGSTSSREAVEVVPGSVPALVYQQRIADLEALVSEMRDDKAKLYDALTLAQQNLAREQTLRSLPPPEAVSVWMNIKKFFSGK